MLTEACPVCLTSAVRELVLYTLAQTERTENTLWQTCVQIIFFIIQIFMEHYVWHGYMCSGSISKLIINSKLGDKVFFLTFIHF